MTQNLQNYMAQNYMTQNYMARAIKIAQAAATANEIPVAAIIIDNSTQKIIAKAQNRTIRDNDPLAHAEMLAIKSACRKLGQMRLTQCSLYVTLEPCAMCAAAIAHARIDTLIFGAYDPKSGGTEHGAKVFSHATTHHKPKIIGGIMETQCRELLQNFFAKLRETS